MQWDQDEEDRPRGIPEWVITFGDMMSLLLTFFIMLVSLSEIKEVEQYRALVESIRRQFGYESSTLSVVPGNARPRNAAIQFPASQGRARMLDMVSGGDKVQAPVGDHPQVRIVRPGQTTAVGTVVFFAEGTAALDAAARQELVRLLPQITGKPQKIEIRGHTSRRPLPPDSPYGDNYGLAYQRCRQTMQFLIDQGVEEERLRISQAGPNEPMHIDFDPSKQQQNPRVEIFMLDEVASDLSGTSDEKQRRFTDRILP